MTDDYIAFEDDVPASPKTDEVPVDAPMTDDQIPPVPDDE